MAWGSYNLEFFFIYLSVSDFTQSVYGSILALEDIDEWVWPPSQILRMYAWWCETYDPLLAHNPMWYVLKY
jgi:hypothetical protein